MPEFSQLAVVSDGKEEQTIEVLFQQEAQLEVTMPLFYVNTGKEELKSYVDDVCKPALEDTVSAGKAGISDYVENIQKPALDNYTAARKSEIAEYVAEVSKPDIASYVQTEVKPYGDQAQSSAAAALASEQAAKQSEINAAASETAAEESAAAAQQYRDEAAEIIRPTQATEDKLGIAKLATEEEMQAGTDDTKIVTPLKAAGAAQRIINQIQSHVTDCFLENPHLVNVSMSGGSLTLASGSVVTVPYGTAAPDKSIGDSLNGGTISDISWDGSKLFYYVRLTADRTNIPPSSGKRAYMSALLGIIQLPIENYFSGEAAPTSYQYMFWYDTSANYIKYTEDYGATWSNIGNYGLPFAIVNNGVIDTVFQSVGYIGLTIWAGKGVKGLVPNGRNADGSLANQQLALGTVKTVNISSTASTTQTNIRIYADHIGAGKLKYDEKNNLNLEDPSGVVLSCFNAGTFSASNGSLYDFNLKTVFRAADDGDVVHNCGSEIISGSKTHIGILTAAAVGQPSKLRVVSQEMVLGTTPAAVQRNQVSFYDKNGAHYGIVETNLRTDGSMEIVLAARSSTDNSFSTVWVNQDADGVGTLHTNCTPAAADNSDKLPPTKWVRSVCSRFVNYGSPTNITTPTSSAPYTTPYDCAYISLVRPGGSYGQNILYVDGQTTSIAQAASNGYTQNRSSVIVYLKKGQTIYWEGTVSETYYSTVYPLL